MPALVHDGRVIRESAIICEYLEEVFPDPPLGPADALGRAGMRLWTRKPDDGLHRACATCANAITFRHQWRAKSTDEIDAMLRATPDPVRRDWRREMIELGTESKLFRNAVKFLDVLFDEMEDALDGRPWLLGEDFTLADIALYPYINRVAEVQLHPIWERTRPRVTDWFSRFRARDSFKTAFGNYPYDDYIAEMKEHGKREWPRAEAALKV